MAHLERTKQLLQQLEGQLAEGKTPRDIQQDLVNKSGYTPRHAYRIMRMLYTRLETQASKVDRDVRRAQIREAGWAAYGRALAREALALDKEGGEHKYESPDAGAAVRALELLCRLDGLLEQPKFSDASGFGDDSLRSLHLHYHGDRPADPVAEGVEVKVLKTGNGHNGSNGHG